MRTHKQSSQTLDLLSQVMSKGTSIKDVRFFCDFWRYLPPYVLYTMYVISTYVLCPIFLDILTYPKIGHPLWTFPKQSCKNLSTTTESWVFDNEMIYLIQLDPLACLRCFDLQAAKKTPMFTQSYISQVLYKLK